MKSKQEAGGGEIEWLPAERLGQLQVDANVRPWLIGQGLLPSRMKAVCGERFGLRLVDQWSGSISAGQKAGLRVGDETGLFSDLEMTSDQAVWVYAQTVTPDSTLCLHAWLAELGDTGLEETLEGLPGIERSAYEYAWLAVQTQGGEQPAAHDLTERALRTAAARPAGLWVRRSRLALRGAPLLIQEVFLPATGLV